VKAHPRSLRAVLAALGVAIAVLAGLVALLLVLITSWLSAATASAVAALQAARVAEEAQLALLAHGRSSQDREERHELEAALNDKLIQARLQVAGHQQAAWDRVEDAVAVYRESQWDPASLRRSGQRLTEAAEALNAFAALNLAEARRAQDRSARLDRLANAVGGCVLVLILLLGPAAAWCLQLWVFRPVLELTSAIRGFGAGDREVRATQRGPIELREAARRFNDLADELSRQREMRMALLAGVAHDLRTPLQVLRLAVGTMAFGAPERLSEPRWQENARRAQRQIERLDRMIGDFFSTVLVEAGQLSLEIQIRDLRQVAAVSVESFRATLDAHELVLSLPPEPAAAPCDAGRMEQVFNNLLSNAAKYSPPGSRIVAAVALQEGWVDISVSDEGPGIPRAEQDRVFEPFRRGRTAAHSAIPGTGLGLFVARRIVEAHRGSLQVRSRPGRGSTFTVCLPRG
jgi:signal transduction histidine kinase